MMGDFMTFQERKTSLQGTNVNYLHAGENGEHLLLLHGGGTDSACLSWGHLVTSFAGKHKVFAPDWPGYGESDRPDVQYSIPYYISVLTDFTNALGLDRISIAGISMGGAIGLGFTLNHPDRVGKLVLVDSYGLQDRAPAHKLSYLFVRMPLVNSFTWWTIARSRSMAAASLKGIFSDPNQVTDELVDLVFAELNKPKAGQAFRSFQMEEMRWDTMTTVYMDRLDEIQVPALIIHGAQDSLVPLHFAEEAHSRIQGSKLIVIPVTGHWPQREKPEEFYKIVSAFLEE
jgi:pimeloyl-ACP methyl ester carboxylesterase